MLSKKEGGERGVLMTVDYWEGMWRGRGKNKEWDLDMIIFDKCILEILKNHFNDKQKLNSG